MWSEVYSQGTSSNMGGNSNRDTTAASSSFSMAAMTAWDLRNTYGQVDIC